MKKRIVLLLAIILIAVLFTGCGEDAEVLAEPLSYEEFIADYDIDDIAPKDIEHSEIDFAFDEILPTTADISDFVNGWHSRYSEIDFAFDETPPIISDLRDFANRWYSRELFALGEEALHHLPGQVYRFSYFHAFWNSFTVRIIINDDGTGDVFYKIGDRSAGPYSSGLLRYERARLNEAETLEFLNLLNKTDFWSLSAEVERMGLDGWRVVIEGVKDGVYHIVDRWVPESNDPVSDIEQFFHDLVEQKFPGS